MKKIKLALVTLLAILSFGVVTAKAEPIAVDVVPTDEVAETKTEKYTDWIDAYFSPEKVAMYVSWIAYIGTIVGLVANIKRLRQTNNLTLKNVSDEFRGLLSKTVGEEVAKRFDDIVPNVVKVQEQTNGILTIFSKVLALSQENTPESRVAILNLISELGVVNSNLIDTSKQAIADSIAFAEESKKEIEKKIEKIEQAYDGTSI